MPGPLKNTRHEAFARALAKGMAASAAYESSGYKPDDGHASRLAGNGKVMARVNELLGNAAKRAEVTIAKVIEELARLGFANMLDYVRVGSDGDAYVDLSTLTREQAAAIQEVTVEDFKDGRGEGARDVRRVKFKLADKRAALVDLGKHFGAFKERVEHTGRDGGPIQTEEINARETILSRITGIASRSGAGSDSGKPH